MLAATSPLSRWQALSCELLAVLDHAATWTDFAPTLELIAQYRAKLDADVRWSNSTSHEITRDAIVQTLLGKWGANGLTAAIYDLEASARFHGAQERAA
jgi:hypothetical protein